jgi:hypothetical protein
LKNTFVLYGYDFSLDKMLTPWLPKVSASPLMEHSTPVKERLCQQMIADTLKSVVDVPKGRVRLNAEGKHVMSENPHEWDAGSWYLLYKEKSTR